MSDHQVDLIRRHFTNKNSIEQLDTADLETWGFLIAKN